MQTSFQHFVPLLHASDHDITSSLIGGCEEVYVHTSSRRLLDVPGQHPSASQDPGQVSVERAKVVGARVHQRV